MTAIFVVNNMVSSVQRRGQDRLERSCGPADGDWLWRAPSDPVFDRFEAFFSGHAYDPHRHDVYAVGFTVSGVQLFDYRGARADSRAGNTIVIHPDECHDGRAGIESGFRYRMLYVEPRIIGEVLGTARSLPFVPSAVLAEPRLLSALLPILSDLDQPLEPLERDAGLLGLAEALQMLDPSARRLTQPSSCAVAVDTARAYLEAHFEEVVDSVELERICGLDRFTLARQFRHRLGTSPYRYLTMRRLDAVRRHIRRGASLADAAAASGFADQSHMTRQFRGAYGLPPGRWLAMHRADSSL